MVMESDAKISMTDWCSQTNWTVASGYLQDCITFESSLSLANEGGDEVGVTTVDSTLRSPLILYPASADSGPCEIKINFAQKHEVLQVYVRSTARAYEIYCEPDVQSSNEYLCTVRCGIAARDGEVLHALNVEEVVSSHVKDFKKGLAEENIRSEDDWVDVKIPDSSVDGGNHGLQTKSCINSAKSSQDLFEATAEISDVNPCISVTLRLLSLQNKGCICIDEIYVFADPVTLADSERQESNAENSSGNSLMAMFLPTLMQLSKTTALSNINEKHPPVRKEKQYCPEADLGKSHPCDSVIKNQLEGRVSKTDHQDGELLKVNEESEGPSQSNMLLQDASVDSNLTTTSQAALMESNQSVTPSQAAKIESNDCDRPSETTALEKNHGDFVGVNVERALEQLVSRMDRMEAICLGFQEKMLMPISSIEARLQQVEQQLETLTMKLHNSGLPSCSRIYAPNDSCIQLDANSCDNCHGNNATEGLKPDKSGSLIEELSVSPDDMSDTANTTQLHPGLIVTAPEFLDAEDEEEIKTSGLETTSNDNQRQHLSIDDAVASALAGFLSSVSLETPRYTKSLVVRAPEFTNEDDHENDDASPRTSYEMENNDDSNHLKGTESIYCLQESTSNNLYLEREQVNRGPNDKESEEADKESEEFCQHSSAEDDQKEACVEAGVIDEHDPGTSSEHTAEDNKTRNIIGQINYGLSSKSDIPKLYQTDNISSSSTEGEVCVNTDRTDTVAAEVPQKASHEDIIENFLGFSRGSSVVDFETSILDVKFISQGNHVTKPFFEALVDTPETMNSQDHSVGENSDDLSIDEQLKANDNVSVAEKNDLISIDVAEPVNPAPNGHCSVYEDYCAWVNTPMPVEVEGDKEDRKRKCKLEEIAFLATFFF